MIPRALSPHMTRKSFLHCHHGGSYNLKDLRVRKYRCILPHNLYGEEMQEDMLAL